MTSRSKRPFIISTLPQTRRDQQDWVYDGDISSTKSIRLCTPGIVDLCLMHDGRGNDTVADRGHRRRGLRLFGALLTRRHNANTNRGHGG